MRGQFYTTAQLGDKKSVTPEGYLLFHDVRIARTGWQIYGPGETPVETGPDGLVHIYRAPEEVFRPETINSANGKPLVNDHPKGDVDPDNWKHLTDGITLHPRRSGVIEEFEGQQVEFLLADVMVCDRKAIGLVDAGKVELSLGYDNEYVQDEPGKGRQTDILINHNALVDQGRCGSKCSLTADKAHEPKPACGCGGDSKMALKGWAKVKDAIHKVKDAKDDKERDAAMDVAKAAHDEAVEEANESRKWTDTMLDELKGRVDTHDAKFKTHDEDIAELKKKDDEEEEEEKSTEDRAADEANEGKADDAKKTRDSAFFGDTFQSTISTSEIIAPGLHYPAFDSKSDRKKTLDSICSMRRKALGVAAATTDGAVIISEVRGGKVLDAATISTMDCAQVKPLFQAVGAAYKQRNSAAARVSVQDHSAVQVAKGPTSMAEFQKKSQELRNSQR